jgi:serine/threonine-protein kinase
VESDLTHEELRVGTDFGPFSIVGLVGRGGMGVVYRARQRYPDRIVALKVLSADLASRPDFRERFVREWNSAAIDHPNIVPVYQAGEISGQLYIAMRYVEGTDLGTLINRSKTLDPARVIWILRQVGLALDAAHARQLVHRDVKPANILVASGRGMEPGDHAYLTDFGLTQDLHVGGTYGAQLVGTVEYMAPEQIESDVVDGRADQYSLSCVLFEGLVGTPPFRRANAVAVMHAHLTETAPQPSVLKPSLPPVIDTVVARGMAKRPDDRYSSCSELIMDAAAALGTPIQVSPLVPSEPIVVLPPDPVSISPRSPVGPVTPAPPETGAPQPRTRRRRWLVAAIVAVLVGSSAAFFLMRPKSAPSPAGLPTEEQAVANAPDYLVAFSSARGGNLDIYEMHTNGSGLRVLESSLGEDEGPQWSPDASRIVFTSSRFGSADLFMLDVATGAVTRLTYTRDVDEAAADWSPDGTTIAYQASRVGETRRQIYVMDLNGTNARNLSNNEEDDALPDWSPDGSLIAFVSKRDGNGEIYVMDADGGNQRNLTGSATSETGPAWSPHGDEIAFQSLRGGNPEIWVMPYLGGDWRRVTKNPAMDNGPVWSPDGAYLSFTSNRDGNKELYLIKATGSTVWRLTNDPGDDGWLSFYPILAGPSATPS